jgi:hypothetical protein
MQTRQGSARANRRHRSTLSTAAMSVMCAGAAVAGPLAALEDRALSAQDKYTIQVANGLRAKRNKIIRHSSAGTFLFNLTRLPLRANTQEYATTRGEC